MNAIILQFPKKIVIFKAVVKRLNIAQKYFCQREYFLLSKRYYLSCGIQKPFLTIAIITSNLHILLLRKRVRGIQHSAALKGP